MDKTVLHYYEATRQWEDLSQRWEALRGSCNLEVQDLQEEVFQALTEPLPTSYRWEDSQQGLISAGPSSLFDVLPQDFIHVSEEPDEQLTRLITFGKQATERALYKELADRIVQETKEMQTARHFMEQSGEPVSWLDGRKLRSYPSLGFSYREATHDLTAVQEELELGNLVTASEHYLFGRSKESALAVYDDGRRALKDIARQEKVLLVFSAAGALATTGGAILAGVGPALAGTFIAPFGFEATQRGFHNNLWNQDLSVQDNLKDWGAAYLWTLAMFKYVGLFGRGMSGIARRYLADSAGFATWAPIENGVHQLFSSRPFNVEEWVYQTASPEAFADQQTSLLALKVGGYPFHLAMKPIHSVAMERSLERMRQSYLDALPRKERWAFEAGTTTVRTHKRTVQRPTMYRGWALTGARMSLGNLSQVKTLVAIKNGHQIFVLTTCDLTLPLEGARPNEYRIFVEVNNNRMGQVGISLLPNGTILVNPPTTETRLEDASDGDGRTLLRAKNLQEILHLWFGDRNGWVDQERRARGGSPKVAVSLDPIQISRDTDRSLPDGFGQSIVDRVIDPTLRDAIKRQWPESDRDLANRNILRPLSNENLGILLMDVFAQKFNLAQDRDTSTLTALRELVFWIQEVRNEGGIVPIQENFWAEAIKLTKK